jgi:hypothetical protein
MIEGEPTKVCPFCAEYIKAAAKVCPHCQSKLVRYARLRQELGIAFGALILMGTFIALIAWTAPDDERKGRSFAGHQADLRVERVSVKSVGESAGFQITGIVTNVGNYPWRVREIEVRFQARNGELIEVQHPQINEPFVVQPAQEAAFCLPVYRLRPKAITAALEARVQDATDGNREPTPD